MARGVSTNMFEPTARSGESKQASIDVSIPEGAKSSVSFYFSDDTIGDLEEARAILRRMVEDRARANKVTKSAIVEVALLAALQDLQRCKAASMLASVFAGD